MKILRRLVSIMSYFQQNLRYILLISGAICFLPLLLNLPLDPPVDSDSNLAKAFESPFYHYSLVASIAVSIPMLMDYVLDLLYRDRSSRSESFIPRRDLVLGLLLPDIFLLCYVVPLRHYELYPCIVSARDAFYFFCFVSHMIKSGSPVWTHKTTSVLAIFVSAFKAFSSFDASLPKSKYPLFGMFTTITKYTAIFVVFSLFLWWFYRVYFNKESLPEKKLYEFNVYATSFFLLILSYVVLNLTIAGDNWTVNDWGYTSAYTYCISLFTTTVSVLNNRIVRIEAAATEAREAGISLQYDCSENLSEIFKGESNAAHGGSILRMQIVDGGAGISPKPGSIISAAVLGMESIAQSYSRSPRISNRIAPTRSTDSPLGLGLGTGIGTLTGTVRYDISPNSNHNRTRVSSPNPNPNQQPRMELAERQKPFPSRHVPIFRKLQLHRMSSLVGFHSIDNNDSEVNVEVPQSKETLSHRIAPVGVDKQASADLRLALLRQSF
eukprot:gene9743-20262_t